MFLFMYGLSRGIVIGSAVLLRSRAKGQVRWIRMEYHTRKAGEKGKGIKVYASKKCCNAPLAFFLSQSTKTQHRCFDREVEKLVDKQVVVWICLECTRQPDCTKMILWYEVVNQVVPYAANTHARHVFFSSFSALLALRTRSLPEAPCAQVVSTLNIGSAYVPCASISLLMLMV